jgi:uncharacterized delta-60 repeat protein
VAVQPDGRIVAVGSAIGATGVDWGLARFRPDGAPDTTFGSGGVVSTDFGGDLDFAAAVALQTDGGIVVAGVEGDDSGAGRDFALARYTAGGGLDATFGSGGRVTTTSAATWTTPPGRRRSARRADRRGRIGHHCLCGDNGADAVVAGDGNDVLDGGNGPDLLIGGPGADAFRGGRGLDRSPDSAPGQGDTTDGTQSASPHACT